MNVCSSRMLVACVGAICLSGASLAAVTNNYIAPEARNVEGGRDVRIVIGQAEIKANINALNTTAAAGGGLLFAMIDAGVNNARAKDAETFVVPLREALVGYEFDPRVEMASAMSLSGLDWFGAKQTQLSKDESGDATLAALDAAATPQLMVLRYTYETTADFSAILVHLNTQLVKKEIPAGKKPNARLNPKNLAFVQSVRSVILLPDAESQGRERQRKGLVRRRRSRRTRRARSRHPALPGTAAAWPHAVGRRRCQHGEAQQAPAVLGARRLRMGDRKAADQHADL